MQNKDYPVLRECPFCGRKPSKVRRHHIADGACVYYYVECKSPISRCFVKPRTIFCEDAERAAYAWNRRTSDE